MSGIASPLASGGRAGRMAIWVLAATGLLLVLGANIHLVYLAVASQPACVPHLRLGESGRDGASAAARSACTPAHPDLPASTRQKRRA